MENIEQWELCKTNQGTIIRTKDSKMFVCSPSLKNEALISASPELLSALTFLIADIERNDGDQVNRNILIEEAKTAIKKATT